MNVEEILAISKMNLSNETENKLIILADYLMMKSNETLLNQFFSAISLILGIRAHFEIAGKQSGSKREILEIIFELEKIINLSELKEIFFKLLPFCQVRYRIVILDFILTENQASNFIFTPEELELIKRFSKILTLTELSATAYGEHLFSCNNEYLVNIKEYISPLRTIYDSMPYIKNYSRISEKLTFFSREMDNAKVQNQYALSNYPLK